MSLTESTHQATAVRGVLGHVGLNVSDLDRSLDFYSAVLDLEVLATSSDPNRRWAFLGRTDDGVLLTLWQQSTGRFAADRPGLHHLAFQVDDLATVKIVMARLESRGISTRDDGVVAHREGATSGGIFFEDPDGTRIEIFTPSGIENHQAPADGAPSCGFF